MKTSTTAGTIFRIYESIIDALHGALKISGLPESNAPLTPKEGVSKEEENEDTENIYGCGKHGC